jgi:hypothetical protein
MVRVLRIGEVLRIGNIACGDDSLPIGNRRSSLESPHERDVVAAKRDARAAVRAGSPTDDFLGDRA